MYQNMHHNNHQPCTKICLKYVNIYQIIYQTMWPIFSSNHVPKMYANIQYMYQQYSSIDVPQSMYQTYTMHPSCASKHMPKSPKHVSRMYHNIDQGIKFCSIFKVLRMQRKQFHCVHLIFLIPVVYLLSQTESVWRRYRDLFAKTNRQKFDADYTCPYSPYSPYGLTW
jgi:hypothetical protein